MKSKAFVGIITLTFVLSGCFSSAGNSSRPKNGGVVQSVDGGVYFEARNTVSEEVSLNRANALSLSVSSVDPNTLYLGTKEDGMYVSKNAGDTWTAVDFPPRRVDVVATDPNDLDIIYVGAVWEKRGRVYKSVDAGASWNEIYVEPVENTRVRALKLAPGSSSVIVIGTSINESKKSALIMSEDAGRTWKNLRTNVNSVLDIGFDAANMQQLYMRTTKDDVLRTSDGGETWESITKIKRTQDQKPYYGNVFSFFAHPKNPGELYVGTDTSLYKSLNYGDSWEQVDIIGSAKGIPIRAISVSPFDSNKLTFSSDKAIYVLVGDERWTVTDTKSDQAVSFIEYDPINRDVLYIGFYHTSS